MTIKLKSLRNDLKAEREGDWVSPPTLPGTKFKVKHIESPEYQDAYNLRIRDLSAQYRGQPLPTDVSAKETGRLIAKHILLDWVGLDELYSPELGEEIMTDPGYRQIHDAVNYCANLVGRSKMEFVDDGVKN